LAGPPVGTPEEVLRVGDEITVAITGIDRARRRLFRSQRAVSAGLPWLAIRSVSWSLLPYCCRAVAGGCEAGRLEQHFLALPRLPERLRWSSPETISSSGTGL
jgi:hypothetical protein